MSILLEVARESAVLLAGGFAGWLFTRKQKAAETQQAEATAQNSELENVEKAIKIWRDQAEVMTREVNKLREELHSARQEIDSLRKDIESLHEENLQLKREIHGS